MIENAAGTLRRATRLRPTLAIVLGSGFNAVAELIQIAARVSYRSIPGFPQAKVAGHQGNASIGHIKGTPVLLLCGRAHYYEGHRMETVTFPIRALAAFGIRDLLLTNAAGAINRRFRPGDFMMLSDHINGMGDNPLRGWTHAKRAPFVDLSEAYDGVLRTKLRAAARKAGVQLREGVYVALSGPSYETPAEIRAWRRLGADAAGMSTVPEVIVARHCGLRVAGLSCLTNWAAGIGRTALSHREVLETGRRAGSAACRLIEAFVRRVAD